ncbi:MAG: molybdopterin molybdotransferase MoeA [Saccharofermentanales bacterium]
MLNVLSAEETIRIIEDRFKFKNLSTEIIPLDDCTGRILSEDISSGEDIPSFNRSTVDGYAVVSSETAGASETSGVLLKMSGRVKMGEQAELIVSSGSAAYVPTGGAIPEGADAVVMTEYAEECGKDIYISRAAQAYENIVFIGDDARKDETILVAGTKIGAREVGVLAALGITRVPVWRRLTCGIFATGDELVPSGEGINGPKEALVRDVNSYTTAALVSGWGMQTRSYGICRDNLDDLRSMIIKAADECDIVLFSGGSSAGILDNSAAAISSAGGEVLVHGISIKPGKPTIIGILDNKAIISLPGHPVSAFFVAIEIIRHVYLSLSGENPRLKPYIKATLSLNIPSNHGRMEYVPVRLQKSGDIYNASPVGLKSGLITLLSHTDGYLIIERDTEGLPRGTEVTVYFYD